MVYFYNVKYTSKFQILFVEAYVPQTEHGIRTQHVMVILGKLKMVAMDVPAHLVVQEIEKTREVILVKAMVGIGRAEITEVARVKAMEETTQKLAEEVEMEEIEEMG